VAQTAVQIVATLIMTAKLNDIDPQMWLADSFPRRCADRIAPATNRYGRSSVPNDVVIGTARHDCVGQPELC
jgi:hypothetical protein